MVPEDDRCELNPDKVCDNCFQCLEPSAGQDYAKIEIAAVYTDDDYLLNEGADDLLSSDVDPAPIVSPPDIHIRTLQGMAGKRRMP